MTPAKDNTPPCVFPLPNFDKVTAVFGPSESAYLTREQLGDWYGMYGDNSDTPFHKCAEGLFAKGGSLKDYGLVIKSDLDAGKVATAVRALMSSWAPKHEIKIGTVAVALANWCEIVPTNGMGAEQAQPASQP